MQVSIIIPAYNSQQFLAQTIESVLAQTLTDWELIVVDDGSTDETPYLISSYLERDSRVNILRQANAGVAQARNRGWAATCPQSEFVIFLDHDDVWEPDALATLRGLLQARPEAVAAQGVARCIDANGRPCRVVEAEVVPARRHGVVGNRVVPWSVEAPTTFAVEAVYNTIATPGQALLRRSALEAVGSFDPAFVPADDYALWLRLTQRGPIPFTSQIVINWRQHTTNQSRNLRAMTRATDAVRRSLIQSPLTSRAEREMMMVGYVYNEVSVGHLRLQWARSALAQRKTTEGIKQMYHAARSFGRALWGRLTLRPWA